MNCHLMKMLTTTSIVVPMKVSPAVANRTLKFLRSAVPKGHSEADDLLDLIVFYEKVLQESPKKHRH